MLMKMLNKESLQGLALRWMVVKAGSWSWKVDTVCKIDCKVDTIEKYNKIDG